LRTTPQLSMFKLLFTLLVIILAINNVSAAEIRFNEALLNQTDCSLDACAFEWNSKSSWIGGVIPGRNDDVYISDSPYQIEIHCPYFCEARSISGNNLFLNMTKMSALINVTTFNVNTLSLANGVLRSSSINSNGTVELDGVVTVGASTLSVNAVEFRLTDSDVDLVALNANTVSSYSSLIRIDQNLVVASQWTVQNTTMRIYGTCQCPTNSEGVNENSILHSEVHVRTSCNFCLNDHILIKESYWLIESMTADNETYELTEVEYEFQESTLAVTANVKLVINETVTLNDAVVTSTQGIDIAEYGTLQGSGEVHSSVTAKKSSFLATSHGDLHIEGLVTLNEGSTLQIENGTFYVSTLQIFNGTKLSIEEGSTNTELVVATDLIAGSFSDLDFYDPSIQLVYNYTHIYIEGGIYNAPQTSDEPSAESPQSQEQSPHGVQQSPTSSVNPPSGEESSTDGKLVAIVILSILLGMMTIAVAVLVLKMRQLQAGYMPLNSKILPFSDDDM
jgi:hypothetical protein